MKIAILKEAAPGETRCAAIPETVKKFIGLGAEVAVEQGAGEHALIADSDFEAAGASLGSRKEVLKGAGAILCVLAPDPASLGGAEKGALLVGLLNPAGGETRSTPTPPRASKRWRWSGCRGSRAPSRWTCCRRSRTSPATKP